MPSHGGIGGGPGWSEFSAGPRWPGCCGPVTTDSSAAMLKNLKLQHAATFSEFPSSSHVTNGCRLFGSWKPSARQIVQGWDRLLASQFGAQKPSAKSKCGVPKIGARTHRSGTPKKAKHSKTSEALQAFQEMARRNPSVRLQHPQSNVTQMSHKRMHHCWCGRCFHVP